MDVRITATTMDKNVNVIIVDHINKTLHSCSCFMFELGIHVVLNSRDFSSFFSRLTTLYVCSKTTINI